MLGISISFFLLMQNNFFLFMIYFFCIIYYTNIKHIFPNPQTSLNVPDPIIPDQKWEGKALLMKRFYQTKIILLS